MTSTYAPLTVSSVRAEIGGQAKTVEFEATSVAWAAGQHLPIRFEIGGEEVRRCYSISSSPSSGDRLRITVKRVEGGLVSNYINDSVDVGSSIEAMPPAGRFTLKPEQSGHRTHYFFAAGSGITPIFAMLHTVLVAEPYSAVHLVYGNANAKSIIFRERIDQLLAAHPDRMKVAHVLSKPGMLSSFGYWRRGLIDAECVEAAIKENPPYAQDAQYYICGPGTMNTVVRQALRSIDVPDGRTHSESYGGEPQSVDVSLGVPARAVISLGGKTIDADVSAGETVLAAARRAGCAPPFSCESGVCGTCIAKLSRGNVHMHARMALSDDEIAADQILTCQAVPTTNTIAVEYPS